MALTLPRTSRASRVSSLAASGLRRARRRPYVLAGITWAYVLWSILPVVVAVQFSFNAGRSRSVWQGFSLRWYVGDPVASVLHDASLRLALTNSIRLAVLTTLITTPLGVALALGLARWRGRGSGAANTLMLLPLATPEIVMGSALFLVFTDLFRFVPLGPVAQLLGHVTFSISYVVVIVRARLASIGTEYETAARDLGATPMRALRTVLLPLLTPSVFAAAMIVFAGSMDDFVISSFLSSDASSATVPIKLYSAVRSSPTPALNALATLLLVGSFLAVVLAWLVIRRRGDAAGGSALEQLASMDG
ncbi:ABC transporter permease [Streptacidiphilus rugosus]|uniref:ABC transporter permease n=1 Tax=Streptacidiphilus rugosus TaxID=405783 RepID=UPI000A063E6E|nr:ABC transporter permease [Streptacidiphilus rugosus]